METNIGKAIQIIEQNMLTGNKKTWPHDMFIYVKVEDLRNVYELLGGTTPALNEVGARKKE